MCSSGGMLENMPSTSLSKGYTKNFINSSFPSPRRHYWTTRRHFRGKFYWSIRLPKGPLQNVDNGAVLVAAFIQAFATGIPMFMVISFHCRYLATFGKVALIAA